MWVDLCILVTLVQFSAAFDEFLVIGKKCITNSSSAVAINSEIHNYFNYVDAKAKYVPKTPSTNNCEFNAQDACTSRWINDAWSVKSSLGSTNVPHPKVITDKRWEDFEQYHTKELDELKYTKVLTFDKNIEISLSIRAEYEIHIFLCDGPYPPTSNCYWLLIAGFEGNATVLRKCSAYTIPRRKINFPQDEECKRRRTDTKHDHKKRPLLTLNSWRHFKLRKRGKKIQFSASEEPIKLVDYYDDEEDDFEAKYLMIHSKRLPALWKLHQYCYLYSETSSPQYKQMGAQFKLHANKVHCFEMFIIMCADCYLSIQVVSSDGTILHMERYEESEWKQIRISVNSTMDQTAELRIRNYGAGSTPFWAIDSFRECRENEFRIFDKESKNPSCEMLSSGNSINILEQPLSNQYDYECNNSEFGPNCLPCEIFFGDKNCPAQKYCALDGDQPLKCYCTAGYQGSNCNIECPNGNYGHSCQKICKTCTKYICGAVDGKCDRGCIEGFTGDYCDKSIEPRFENPPKLIKCEITECSLIMENAKLSGNVALDQEFTIEYTTKNASWRMIDEKYKISEAEKTELKLINLDPDTEYSVRAVIIVDHVVYNKYAIVRQIHTLCKLHHCNEINISTTNTTASLVYKGAVNYCDPKNYKLFMDNLIISFNPILILNLKPFTLYNLTIRAPKLKEEEFCTFKTQEGIPDKVENLQIVNTTESTIDISWKAPKTINGHFKAYIVKYEYVKPVACSTNTNIIKNPSELNVQDTISHIQNLAPFSYYNIFVYAATLTTQGNIATIQTSTKQSSKIFPPEYPTITHKLTTENQLTLSGELNCDLINGPIFLLLNFSCEEIWCNENIENELWEILKISEFRKSLISYSTYTLTIYISRSKTFDYYEQIVEEIAIKTHPSTPSAILKIEVTSKNDTSVSLRWKPPYPPNGELEEYMIFYQTSTWTGTNYYKSKIKPEFCKLWVTFHCGTVSKNIYSGYNYNIQILAENRDVPLYNTNSGSVSVNIDKLAPEPPYDVEVKWDENDLTIYWKHPNNTNGLLSHFSIDIFKGDKKSVYAKSYKILSENDYKFVYNLEIDSSSASIQKCSQYTLKVSSYNINSFSSNRGASQKFYSPPPSPNFTLTTHPENTSILMSVPLIPYTETCNFSQTIVICLAGESESLSYKNQNLLDKINQRLNLTIIGNCLVVYAMTMKTGLDFVIGDGGTVFSDYFDEELANDELDSGTSYEISVLIINEYFGQVRYKLESRSVSTLGEKLALIDNSSSNGAVYLLLLLFLVIPIGVFVYRKKGATIRSKFFSPVENDDDFILTECNNATACTNTSRKVLQEHIKVNSLIFNTKHSHIVPVYKIEVYVKESIRNGELEKQHNLFPRGQTKSWKCGSEPQNKPKNRYANLPAYDHTRVKLANNESDYINANYIDGYKNKKSYIATQGPKKSTLNDFWKMIWQENVSNIIMLANLIENEKKKVDQYWPEINTQLDFDGIQVQYISTEIFANYVCRKFNVFHQKQQRKVTQLHFTSWPDHGIPLYPQSLVQFLQRILKVPNNPKHPVVVHCSAGVGRTGTVILCDIALRMAAGERYVDFLSALEHLRAQRASMVDNIEQYKLAHLVVLECLNGMNTAIKCNNRMGEQIAELLQSDAVHMQMKYLSDIEWQDNAMKSVIVRVGDEEHYPEKNRFQETEPELTARIFLPRYPSSDNSSSYINAVYVDGFRNPNRFIATEQPMPNTLSNFWRLIVDKQCSVILCLNELNLNDQSVVVFWPTSENCQIKPVDNITVKYIDFNAFDYHDVISVEVIHGEETVNVVNIILFKSWRAKKVVPNSVENFISFWLEIDAISRRSDPVVVTCFDGVTASGLYIALTFIIEKMKLEHECDVCQAVRNIRHNRRQFVSKQEQFIFLYNAAIYYKNTFDLYANFDE